MHAVDDARTTVAQCDGDFVDRAHHRAYFGGGCRLGDVDAATGPYGMIVPAGIMSETGALALVSSTGDG